MIRNFLDLSTGHLKLSTRQLLSSTPRSDWPVYGAETDYGYFIHVDENPQPNELQAIFDHARSLGCDYVLFDQDAERIDDLPWFEDGEDPLPY